MVFFFAKFEPVQFSLVEFVKKDSIYELKIMWKKHSEYSVFSFTSLISVSNKQHVC